MAPINEYGEIISNTGPPADSLPATNRRRVAKRAIWWVGLGCVFLSALYGTLRSPSDPYRPSEKGIDQASEQPTPTDRPLQQSPATLPSRPVRQSPGRCDQLDTGCLARAVIAAFSEASASKESYLARNLIPDASIMLRTTSISPDSILKTLPDLDKIYYVGAVADVYTFGEAQSLRTMLRDSVVLHSSSPILMHYLPRLVADSLSTREHYDLIEELFPNSKRLSAVVQLRRGASMIETDPKASKQLILRGLNDLQSETNRQDDTYEALRTAFELVLKITKHDEELSDKIITMTPEPHRLVARAVKAGVGRDLSMLRKIVDQASKLDSDTRNYILYEISIISAKIGNRAIYDLSVRSMSSKSSNDSRSKALSHGAVIFQDLHLLKSARESLLQIPSAATWAYADALISIAEAEAFLGLADQAWGTIQKISLPYKRIEAIVRSAKVPSQRLWRVFDSTF